MTVSGTLHLRKTVKISVMGVVREIKHMADIPPSTRQKTKTPWFMLSLVTDRENDERISHFQNISCPP
jgi:lysozyme family protein